MEADSNESAKIQVKKGITTALGVTMCERGYNFAAAVESGLSCELLIFPYNKKEPILSYAFQEEDKIGSIYTILVQNLDQLKYEYVYLLNHEVYLDPYARMITGREKWGELVDNSKVRCAFNFEEFDWEQDSPLNISYHQIVMYSLHVRGFTKHSTSKVKNKGTFEGIVEKIPYFKELGINQIELMPAYEFDEIIPRHENKMEFARFEEDKQYAINYWGYARANYFAPKASYSSGTDSMIAFKNMVKELHKNKIEVIMEFYFGEGVNQNLILDCVRYWVEEYHIDGVHVNSFGVPVTLLATMPRLSNTKIMTESFEIDKVYQEEHYPKYKNLAEYNDGFQNDARRFLKGDEDMLDSFTHRIRRNPLPFGVINYIASHNGFSLMDMVTYESKHNEANGENNKDGTDFNNSWNCGIEGPTRKKAVVELRTKQIKNALLIVLLSQGVPKINSGDEFGNTQNGNNNAYCQDNEISWLDWSGVKKHKELLDFTKELIQLRKEHLILHNQKELKIMDYLSCGYPDLSYHGEKPWYPEFEGNNKQIGVMYCGKYAVDEKKKEDNFIYIAYNMNWAPQDFALPSLPQNKKWRIEIDTSHNLLETTTTTQRNIIVKERSIVVLIGK